MFVSSGSSPPPATATHGHEPSRTDPPIGDLPTERLEAEIATLYSRISAQTCRWLELVAEFDRREAWRRKWGCKTCAEWLSWHCGVAMRAAYDQVRVARRLDDLPAIHRAFADGRLSYSKVRALVRIADPQSEASLLAIALDSTAAQLERTATAYRRATSAGDPKAQAERCFADLRWEDDGCLSVRARLTAEDGAALMRALDCARDELRAERDDDCVRSESDREPIPIRPARTANAEALARVAENSLAAVRSGAGAVGGDRTQVVLHVEEEALATSAGEAKVDHPRRGHEPRCELEDGPGIAAEPARRLACDSSVVVIHEREGNPVSVGRKTRSIPPATRRALRSRDGGCRFPGCAARRFIDAHHVEHWANGGRTDLENLVSLCRHHHRLVHEGGFSVAGDANGAVIFRRPDGVVLPASPRLPGISGLSEDETQRLLRGAHTGRPELLRGALAGSGPDHGRADSRIAALHPEQPRLDPLGTLGPMALVGPRYGHQRLDLEHTLFCLTQRQARKEKGIEPFTLDSRPSTRDKMARGDASRGDAPRGTPPRGDP